MAEAKAEVKVVEYYETPDGVPHKSKEAAQAHMNRSKYAERAEKYVKIKEWPRGQETRAINLISEFLAFEDAAA